MKTPAAIMSIPANGHRVQQRFFRRFDVGNKCRGGGSEQPCAYKTGECIAPGFNGENLFVFALRSAKSVYFLEQIYYFLILHHLYLFCQ